MVFRGRANVLPAALMWSLFGCVGQVAYNRYSAPSSQQQQQVVKEGFWERMANKRWSPVTIMTDQEYANKLRDKLLRVDVEIALLDDKIAALKQEQLESEATKTKEESKPASSP